MVYVPSYKWSGGNRKVINSIFINLFGLVGDTVIKVCVELVSFCKYKM